MTRREVNKIQRYLDEQDSDSSLFMFDDLDEDPDYGVGQPGPSQSHSLPPVHDLCDSDDGMSVDETSKESSNNYSDTDSWVDNWTNIRDFEFDDSSSGIKVNISESAHEFPIEIFSQFWTDDIFEILIKSTNIYGENLTCVIVVDLIEKVREVPHSNQ